MSDEKLVHCKNCKFYEVIVPYGYNITGYFDREVFCNHPSNIITYVNWEEAWTEGLKKPNRLNKKMNCKNYESGLSKVTTK